MLQLNRYLLLLIILSSLCSATHARISIPSVQSKAEKRILFILDASSSMTKNWNGSSRYDEASHIIGLLLDSLHAKDPNIEFALRVIGTNYPAAEKNCSDTKTIVRFQNSNQNLIKQSLSYIEPIGWSPINFALKAASNDDLLDYRRYKYGIILITDGEESCGGDICNTVEKDLQDKFFFQPYIIGLDPSRDLSSYYNCIGEYLPLRNKNDEQNIINKVLDFKVFEVNKSTHIPSFPAVTAFPKDLISIKNTNEVSNKLTLKEKEILEREAERKRIEEERIAKEAEEKRLREKEILEREAERKRIEEERIAKEAEEKRLREDELLRKEQLKAQLLAEQIAQEKAEKEKKDAEILAEQKAKQEAERLAAEQRAKEEAERLAAEQKAKQEAERLAAEQKAKQEAERLAAEQKAKQEAERLAAEQKAKEEAERLAAEQRAKEEAESLAAEQKAKQEAERLAAEQKAKEEAERLAAEQKAKEEAERLAAEQKAKEEAERLAAEQRAKEEAERLEAEQKAKEETERLAAEQKAKQEAERLAAEQKAKEEAERLAAEQKSKQEAERLATEQKAKQEAERLVAEQKAKEEAERLAAEQRAKEEAERIAAEQKAKEEAERLAAEQKAKQEAERLAAEQKAKEEAERLAAEQKAKEEAERLAAEQKAKEEAERLAAEQKAKEDAERLAAEQKAKEEAERLAAEQRAKEEAERLAAEQKAKEEAERIAAEKEALAILKAKEEEEARKLAEAKAELEKTKEEEKKRSTPSPIPQIKSSEVESTTAQVNREDANTTQLKVYLRGTNGEFYQSSPKISLYRSSSSTPDITFNRFVDFSGEPKAVDIAEEGNYTITFGQDVTFLAKNIFIEKNKLNKVIIDVRPGSIKFVYGNNSSKNVVGYIASVQKIFPDKRQAQSQNTEDRVEYTPGNYHITINTLPQLELNVDVFEGSTSTILYISEPGTLILPASLPSEVVLYQSYNSSFSPFMNISITDNKKQYKLLPGSYQIAYEINGVTKKKKFSVRSNKSLNLVLD